MMFPGAVPSQVLYPGGHICGNHYSMPPYPPICQMRGRSSRLACCARGLVLVTIPAHEQRMVASDGEGRLRVQGEPPGAR